MVNAHPHANFLLNRLERLIDTVHKFQGDERDVMIFSPVVSERPPGLIEVRNKSIAFDGCQTAILKLAITHRSICLPDFRQYSAKGYLARFGKALTLVGAVHCPYVIETSSGQSSRLD